MFKKLFKKIRKGFRPHYDRKNFENILEDPESKLGASLNAVLNILLIVFIGLLIFESLGHNGMLFKTELFLFEAFISSAFLIEYLYRFFRAQSKNRFFKDPFRWIDFLSFAPFFLGLFAVGDFLKILRILRVLRVLRLVKKIPLTAGFVKALKDYLDEYKAVFLLFFVTLFIGSFFVYFFERQVSGTQFLSIPETLWWGLVTMTTVGYGDMVPITTMGKIFGSVLVLLGPLVLALISAVTIMVFMETSNNHRMGKLNRRTRSCPRCDAKNPRTALYCMVCGKKMYKKT